MASIGNASLTIVPRFDNLGASVNKALGNIDASAAGKAGGKKYGSSFESAASGGLAKTGALMGVFSKVTETALSSVTSSIGSAISRLDTLNAYPRVMQSLGYSAEQSQASIDLMADRLTGLPTALNDMASTVQGLVAVTGDIDKATQAGLGLNDMLLSSGSSTQVANAAMEQFRQMLAKGKPDMQDWKSLTSAMPGQMQQLAQSMLGPKANANDLYAALGGGSGGKNKTKATISMQQLLDQIIKLDQEGGKGITAFSQTAKEATGGIQSSMDNMRTAIARGVASIFDAIGSDTIKDTLGGVGKSFENALKLVSGGIKEAKPIVFELVGGVKQLSPQLLTAAGAFASLMAASKGVSILSRFSFSGMAKTAGLASESLFSLALRCKEGSRAQNALLSASSALGGKLSGLATLGVGVAVASLGMLVTTAIQAKKKQDDVTKATQGLTNAVSIMSHPVRTASDAYQSLDQQAQEVIPTLDEIKKATDASRQGHLSLVDSITSRNTEYQTSAGLLETYRATINEYANTSLDSSRKQEELKYAVEQVNQACGTQYTVVDAANGKIADQTGKILENTDAINKNIDAKQRQLRQEALNKSYTEAYSQKLNDEIALDKAKKSLEDARSRNQSAKESGNWGEVIKATDDIAQLSMQISELEGNVESDNQSLDMLSEQMFETGGAAAEMAAHMNAIDPSIATKLRSMGTSIDDFSLQLAEAGVSADQFSTISKDQFNEMVGACGGDVKKLVELIKNYNNTPIEDKRSKIDVKTWELTDATGKVYVWNGLTLVDQETGITITGEKELTDSYGNILLWNGKKMEPQKGNITINQGGLGSTLTLIDQWNSKSLIPLTGSVKITGTSGLNLGMGARPLYNYTGKAAGGFRPHAEGAIFGKSGAIVNQATMLNDVVGEAGSEAIIPLDNRRYAQPFVDMLAEGINEQRQTGNTYVTIHMTMEADQSAKKVVRAIGREIKLHGLMR